MTDYFERELGSVAISGFQSHTAPDGEKILTAEVAVRLQDSQGGNGGPMVKVLVSVLREEGISLDELEETFLRKAMDVLVRLASENVLSLRAQLEERRTI